MNNQSDNPLNNQLNDQSDNQFDKPSSNDFFELLKIPERMIQFIWYMTTHDALLGNSIPIPLITCLVYIYWVTNLMYVWNNAMEEHGLTYRLVLLKILIVNIFYNIYKIMMWFCYHISGGRMCLEKELIFIGKILECFFGLNLILLTREFIPFTQTNCYGYSHTLCSSGRVGGFFGVILIILCIITLLQIIVSISINKWQLWLHPKLTQDEAYNMAIFRIQKNPILNNIPFLEYLILDKKICCSCYLDKIDLPTNSTTNLIELSCKHKIHNECLQSGEISVCPFCKNKISEQFFNHPIGNSTV